MKLLKLIQLPSKIKALISDFEDEKNQLGINKVRQTLNSEEYAKLWVKRQKLTEKINLLKSLL